MRFDITFSAKVPKISMALFLNTLKTTCYIFIFLFKIALRYTLIVKIKKERSIPK